MSSWKSRIVTVRHAVGKTIKKIASHSLYGYLLIAFNDNTFLVIGAGQVPYEESWRAEVQFIDHYTAYSLGILSDQEFAKIRDKENEKTNRDQERLDRETYERLKKRFEGK